MALGGVVPLDFSSGTLHANSKASQSEISQPPPGAVDDLLWSTVTWVFYELMNWHINITKKRELVDGWWLMMSWDPVGGLPAIEAGRPRLTAEVGGLMRLDFFPDVSWHSMFLSPSNGTQFANLPLLSVINTGHMLTRVMMIIDVINSYILSLGFFGIHLHQLLGLFANGVVSWCPASADRNASRTAWFSRWFRVLWGILGVAPSVKMANED